MIEITNLYFSYNKRNPYIIENINLKINKGDYISILGQNGSGKSTLIKLILGFLQPLEGKITLNTNNIGYVPQKFDNFNGDFPITVEEVLNCHRKVLKLKDKSLINKSLEKVNMLPYKNNLIGNLSGGQRQKIFIARALMGNPKLLILDEPSTGIDLDSQKEIYKLINHLNITQHLTILSIEHNISAAYYNSTHIFKMESGKGTLYLKEDYIKNNKEVI